MMRRRSQSMQLTTLKLHHFRNLSTFATPCHLKLNVITGKNGVGKTAILEAIYFLSLSRSHRSQELNRLVQFGQDTFTLYAELTHLGQPLYQLGIQRSLKGGALNRLNGEPLRERSQFARLLPILFLHPESFNLLLSGAKIRRQLLDWGSFHLFSEFMPAYRHYQQALRQRNAALKLGRPAAEIRLWDPLLIQSGTTLTQLRKDYLQRLVPEVEQFLPASLKGHPIKLGYDQGFPQDMTLAEAFSDLSRDQRHYKTYYGPHRADLRVTVERKLARDILSRGEQKLLIAALKLAQGKLYFNHHHKAPIYLFDDLAAELDQDYRTLILTEAFNQEAQIFLTAIEASAFKDFLAGKEYNMIPLAVSPVTP